MSPWYVLGATATLPLFVLAGAICDWSPGYRGPFIGACVWAVLTVGGAFLVGGAG